MGIIFAAQSAIIIYAAYTCSCAAVKFPGSQRAMQREETSRAWRPWVHEARQMSSPVSTLGWV